MYVFHRNLGVWSVEIRIHNGYSRSRPCLYSTLEGGTNDANDHNGTANRERIAGICNVAYDLE